MLLIDADVLTYYAAFAAQKTNYYVTHKGVRTKYEDAKAYKAALKEAAIPLEDVVVEPEINLLPLPTCLHIADLKLKAICQATQCWDYRLYTTGDNNFRYGVAKTRAYKGNRVQAKPVYFNETFEFYLRKGALVIDGMEADDAMGIAQTESGGKHIICSIDKDLWQIPGRHYNWQDDGRRFRMSPVDSHLWFMAQVISGDQTDNIPGLKGWGPIKALKFLREAAPEDRWPKLKQLYQAECEKAGVSWQDYLNEQGRLVWILRKQEEVWSINYYDEVNSGKTIA